jgi:hypothetical protein
MSELQILWKAVKNTWNRKTSQSDNSVLINRDGSVRINLDSAEGRARVIDAANSVKKIKIEKVRVNN